MLKLTVRFTSMVRVSIRVRIRVIITLRVRLDGVGRGRNAEHLNAEHGEYPECRTGLTLILTLLNLTNT